MVSQLSESALEALLMRLREQKRRQLEAAKAVDAQIALAERELGALRQPELPLKK